jgi:hypothetical protein
MLEIRHRSVAFNHSKFKIATAYDKSTKGKLKL